MIAEEGTIVDEKLAKKFAGLDRMPVMPFVGTEIVYMSADEEDNYVIAQANAQLGVRREFVNDRVSSRHNQKFLVVARAPHRLHGHRAAPDRRHQRRADPLPGTRRRQPRADGFEHAASGRAPAPARRADCLDGHGKPGGLRQRSGAGRGRGRRSHQRAGRPHRRSTRPAATSASTACASTTARTNRPASTSARLWSRGSTSTRAK